MTGLEVKQTDWVVFSAEYRHVLIREEKDLAGKDGSCKRKYAVKPGKTKVESSGNA